MLRRINRWSRTRIFVLLSQAIFWGSCGAADAQNFGDLFGGMIRMAMVQESWKPLSPLIQSCVNDQLRPNGESIQSLIANGVMANDPRVQPFISKCQQIAAVAGAWRKMDGDTKSCLVRLLQANNQSVSTLAEMGVGPSDPQVLPLISQCQQIDATRKSWASLDPYVNTCVDRFLKNGGQSIETLASERIAPADPQAAPVMAKCQGISSQSLMKNTSCSIDGAPSRCEFYVLETAQMNPLGIDQLVAALIAGESVGKAQLELPGPKAARMARIVERRKGMIAEGSLKKLGGLLDPANKFAFAKASDLRKQIETQRANPKFSEQDILQLFTRQCALRGQAKSSGLRPAANGHPPPLMPSNSRSTSRLSVSNGAHGVGAAIGAAFFSVLTGILVSVSTMATSPLFGHGAAPFRRVQPRRGPRPRAYPC